MKPFEPTEPAPATTSDPGEPGAATTTVPGALRAAAVASLAAGAIHATCVGAHSGEKTVAVIFAVTAAAQIGWGALALVRSGWNITLLGLGVNGAAIGGWVLSRTTGIGFIPGLETAESPGFADTVAAILAGVAIIGSLVAVSRRGAWVHRPHPALVGVAGIAALSLAVPGMVSAGGHNHEHGAAGGDHEHGAAGDDHAAGEHDMGAMPGMDHGHDAAVVAPKAYTGKLPVDLGGVAGVSAKEQKDAEALVTRTIKRLPQFADFEATQTKGYHSIHDAFAPGQFEHLVNWTLIDDHDVLDPDHPESLVYQVQPDRSRKLVAAMYMLPSSVSLDKVPDIGGKLMQWHIHNNLCYAGAENAWVVAGVADPPAPCRPGTFRFDKPAPMVHVWLTPNTCGPFAALEGIGGGQIAAGQTKACDTAHGAPAAS
ncbi:MAG TPA: hypothetical protein VKB57_25705 [Acidimicrobiales bacterium]|nr:hypothetical protein [Acidimicrobiales bacterium]